MAYLMLFALSFAPGLLWLWFFYRKDTLDPEPASLIIKTFLIGMGLGVPATVLELLFTESAVVTVAIAPVIEELLKFAGVRFTVYRRAEFDEPLDGIIYTAAVALGFASIENGLYLLATYLTAVDTAASLNVITPFGVLTSVFLVRALLSVPSHVLYSSMWGYALGRAKFSAPGEGRRLLLTGLVLAILCHALFNFFASHLPQAALAELLLVAIMWRVVFKRIDEGLRTSPHRPTG
ncbi:PrsW family intramembrane metalloprotease [Candidatus Nitrospira bockiana]